MKKKFVIILILILLILTAIVYYFFYYNSKRCLDENEKVSYKGEEKENTLVDITVFINDKITEKELSSFKISDVYKNYHPIELHTCGIYVIKFFNYTPKKSKQESGFRAEIWKYQYNGQGNNLLLLWKKNKDGSTTGDFSPDFRVDPNEHYVVLLKGYFGSSDYAIIIKDLKTLKDVFSLPMTEIEKQKPELAQDIVFENWTKDSRYFWANTHAGANTLGFIRIDTQTWKFDLLSAPADVLGGDALNIENGYITIHPGNVWYGIDEPTNEEIARRKKQGIGTELYVENLFSGKRYLVDKTDEPLWYFKPQWISDTELQYEMPNGEKRIYKIEE